MIEYKINIDGNGYKGNYNSFAFEKAFLHLSDKYEKILRQKAIKDITNIIETGIKKKTKWKSIKQAIYSQIINENESLISVKNEKMQVAKYLHYGTKKHWIEPKRAKALHWIQNGKNRFSKGHYVKGIRAGNYFRIDSEMLKKILSYYNKLFKK